MKICCIFGIIKEMKNIWYSPSDHVKSPDSVHQTLMYGSLDEIEALKKEIGKEAMRELFLKYPKKVYTNEALHFIINYILQITTPIDEQKYLKHTPRNIG
jgi:hypothetical protein